MTVEAAAATEASVLDAISREMYAKPREWWLSDEPLVISGARWAEAWREVARALPDGVPYGGVDFGGAYFLFRGKKVMAENPEASPV